jgi:hypothetical protein
VLRTPSNRTLSCVDVAGIAAAVSEPASASDDCEGDLVPREHDTVIVEGRCASEMTVVRAWTATDSLRRSSPVFLLLTWARGSCGNSVYGAQATVVTNPAPIELHVPGPLAVECGADTSPAAAGTAWATTACDESVHVTFQDGVSGSLAHHNYTIHRMARSLCLWPKISHVCISQGCGRRAPHAVSPLLPNRPWRCWTERHRWRCLATTA